MILQVQGTFKLQYLGLKDDTRAIVVKKIDYQVEGRDSATEIFMSNLKWNPLNQLTSQPERCRCCTGDIFLAVKMMDSAPTEVFETKDYQRSPSLEVHPRLNAGYEKLYWLRSFPCEMLLLSRWPIA